MFIVVLRNKLCVPSSSPSPVTVLNRKSAAMLFAFYKLWPQICIRFKGLLSNQVSWPCNKWRHCHSHIRSSQCRQFGVIVWKSSKSTRRGGP